MASAYPLSEDEDEPNENLGYVTFFEEHLPWLQRIPMFKIPDKVKFDISVLFWIPCIYEEWKDFLNLLGLDIISIGAIDFKSSKSGITPLYLAFLGPLCNKSFGSIIEYFLRKKKYHILRHLKPFIEELLEPHEPSAPELEPTAQFGFSSQYPDKGSGSRKSKKEKEDNDLQKSSMHSTLNSSQLELLSILDDLQPAAFVTRTDAPISVFILHTMSETKSAERLQQLLRERQIRVVISADIKHFLRSNHSMILTAIVKKMDYIIPLLSEELLQQIDSKVSQVANTKDIETIANRFLYILLMEKYIKNRNHRVRPVYESSSVIANIDDYPLFSWPFHWKEIDDLVENLKRTK